ncbi:MAG: isoprenylcysteine carboxylmethyltransferase family protein [Candidatus Riflebacteria bacterium]|nr:isoprenylcysteine carboxylmethyltransferase family protein [Candidatus Riflebacteria bacterium]
MSRFCQEQRTSVTTDPGVPAGHAASDRGPARISHGTFRCLGIVIFTGALAYRLSTHGTYSSRWLFWLETAVPATILAAYLTRPPPVTPARGIASTAVPLVASVLPFGLLHCPPTAFGAAHQEAFLALLCLPTAFMVWAYLCLNRSFAIMAEARELKTAGAYRIVRHPVYLAQLLCGAVVLAWRFCPVSAAVYLLFLAAQLVRIREEEAALALAHPGYADYRRRTWALVPPVW